MDNTYWIHYLDVIPDDYSEYPMFYTEEEWKWLEGSSFVQNLNQYRANIEYDYKLAEKNIPGFSTEYSLKEFKQMYLLNESRQLNNEDFGLYNVPLVDLFNHDKDQSITIKYARKDQDPPFGPGVYITAKRDVVEGEQLNWHYGDKGNHMFLKNYGFTLSDNT